MATVNYRTFVPQANVINGVDAGGAMQVALKEGYDNIMRSSPDGLQVPMKDKEIQYVRGSVVSQDWIHAIDLLTGTVGTYVFYERKSGIAEATGYVKHTITNPVIHRVNLRFGKGGYAAVAFDFECKAADETKGISDMHGLEDSQAAPTYVSAARGGYRIITATHGGVSIYHTTAFDLTLAMRLVKACNDSDVGYTCVDARLDGLTASGSLTFQDASIATGHDKAQQLIVASSGSLVLTAQQGSSAADKTITVAGVDFNEIAGDKGSDKEFNDHTVNYDVANDTGTQLTLAGANKILTIA